MAAIPREYEEWCSEIQDAIDYIEHIERKRVAFNPQSGFWWVY